jgi:hypothetical protein
MSRLAQVHFPLPGHIADRDEGRGHFDVKFAEDFVLIPVMIGVTLNLLEITADNAPGIGDEVRDDEHVPFIDNFIGGRRRRAVGAFGDDPNRGTDFIGVLLGDLMFESGRN